jgi:branched-chain amino acid transport system substrate-binding protein
MPIVRLLVLTIAILAWVASATAQDVLKIGADLPMSGPNAEYGELFGSAAKLAVEHANTDKLLSKRLDILFEDSQATPQQGVVAMTKLVNVEKVPFVLSAFTGVSKAIAPIGDKAKIVSVNGGGIGPDLAELGDYFWNVIPLVNLEIRVIAPYLVRERGFKKIALIYVDDSAGEAIDKELKENVPKAGGQMVSELQVPRNSQQFTSIAAKVREAGPDLVFIASFGATRQRRVPTAGGIFGLLVSDRDPACRGERRAVPYAIGELDRTRHDRAGGEGLESQDGQGTERLCRQLLQRRDGVRHTGASAGKNRSADYR